MNVELGSTITSEQTRIQKEKCIITLDLPQYFFYESAYIDLHAPDGSHLESIGHRIQEIDAENTIYRLHEQIILVESLLGNMHQPVTLPREAVSALAEMLYRMQKITEKMVQ